MVVFGKRYSPGYNGCFVMLNLIASPGFDVNLSHDLYLNFSSYLDSHSRELCDICLTYTAYPVVIRFAGLSRAFIRLVGLNSASVRRPRFQASSMSSLQELKCRTKAGERLVPRGQAQS